MMTVSNLHWTGLEVYSFSFFLNPVATIGFDPANYSVAEDTGNVSVTVSLLSGTLARGLSVVMVTSLNDGTATGGIINVLVRSVGVFIIKPFLITLAIVDYNVTSSDLMFSATTSSQIIAIPILEDTILESSETINVTLTSVDPAAILNPMSAVITIEDNDGK